MQKQKLVLVGNGMAGVRCIEEIVKHDPDRFEIVIFGREPHVNYNRILLSAVLQGNTSFEHIILNDRKWYEERNIQLFTGESVIKIDPENQMIKTDKDREFQYDKLIIATGSVPFLLPIPGNEKEGVLTFRTLEDCQKMIDISKHHKKAVVIGGGLLGLEAAKGLLNLGMEVSVVHIASLLMERQLDPTAARMMQTELESQGMNFLLEKATQEITGQSRIQGLRFTDGTEIEADLVVMAAGVRPNIQLAQDSRIDTNRGILVNDYMETNTPNIYAVGECVEHRGIVYGLVKPLYEQGKVLAEHICGLACDGYEGSILSTQLKISGIDVFSIGQIQDDAKTKAVKVINELERVYKKAVFQGNKLVGAVLFGDTNDAARILDITSKQKALSDEERAELFKPSITGDSRIASMLPNSMICNCNGVTKQAIIEAVQKEELTTVEQIKACTKASGSCGGCKPLVADLLSYIYSEEFNETVEEKTMCPCTDLTEEEIVMEMQLRNLDNAEKTMEKLGWINKEGCPVCRPALNYYLGMIYPEYENIHESLFINQQMNATMQSDGTYAIIPQMYGGITTAGQLRKIADTAQKYQIPNIAVTSEQRIHLMGVKKEDLPAVWADLNMDLSSTYGNTVQSVKTCIGENICQCDKYQSLNLAVDIEQRTEFLVTPYRVKIGVSACMHNGAGSTTKDIGIIGIDRGWEIYAGGSSGRNMRAGELLCIAETDEEAVEMIAGFIQYYRETANYLERTWQWVHRIGLIHVREVLFDQELRQQLLERLEIDVSRRKSLLEKTNS